MPVAEVNGIRLNYMQVESQDPDAKEDLVMVHGLATNLAFWYLHYLPVFSRRYRVTLFDLRGHGRSEMPQDGYTPRDLAADLQMLLSHLDIENAHFVSHSFGGVVTLSMACVEPGLVKSLVLADTHISAVRGKHSSNEWDYGVEIQETLDRFDLSLDTFHPYFGYKLLTEIAKLQLRNVEIPLPLLELVKPLIANQGSRTAARWLRLMEATKAEDELMGYDGLTMEKLRALTFPILAIYGDRSQAKMTGEQLLDVWPHAEFRRVLEAGHFFPTSIPDEVIANCHRFWDGGSLKIEGTAKERRERATFGATACISAMGYGTARPEKLLLWGHSHKCGRPNSSLPRTLRSNWQISDAQSM